MQALCVAFLLGCARAPIVTTGDAARRGLLDRLGSTDEPARGKGVLSVRRVREKKGGLDLRWATTAESLGLVAFAGPIRGLDAAVLGDSLFVTVKRFELGIAGSIASAEPLGSEELRFLLRPWNFASSGIRAAVERAIVDSRSDGWRLRGTLPGDDEAHGFVMDLRRDGSPERLAVRAKDDARDLLTVRYGPLRSYARGRVPRWVEWRIGDVQAKLEVLAEERAGAPRFRRPRLNPDDGETLALDDPRGRDALQRLLGVRGEP